MRQPVAGAKPRRAQLAVFPAPTAGWISNQNLAASASGTMGAFLLRNVFPGTETVILRRGSQLYSTLGGASEEVASFLRYNNGNNQKFFAATPSRIYDITAVADPDVSPAPSLVGLTSGDWYSTMFATSGGTFLVCVNGSDHMRLFDGSDWWEIDDTQTNRLNYDSQTAPFSAGETITGQTSGATAVIKRVAPTYLVLGAVTDGPFEDDEAISSASGGATVNGSIVAVFNGVTGVDTSKLAYVWSYKNRLFFIERDSLNVWYLPIDSITGAAEVFPLGGVFAIGGAGLMFGASWSLGTSGSGGLSEQWVVVTTEGEFAVYQGNDPGSAENWSKVGLYEIGRPLGRRAFVRVGGDILIATSIGLVPLSQAVQRTIATLAPASASVNIEPDWSFAAQTRSSAPWNAVVWPENQMVIVAPPTIAGSQPSIFVGNVRTQAWCEFTGWDVRGLEIFDGRMFFGATGGKVIEANVSGSDQGQRYTGSAIPLFDTLGAPASIKQPMTTRAVVREVNQSAPQVTVLFDYDETLPAPPAPAAFAGADVWGEAVWDEFVWAGEEGRTVRQVWMSAWGRGYALAPCMMVSSNAVAFLDTEIVRIEVTYTAGDVMS